MTFQNRRFTALAALSLVAGLGLTACGSDGDGDSASGDGDLSITMLPKNLGNPYFDTSTGGAEDAAGELGASVEEVGPDTATPDAQVPFINTAAQQGADALIVSANDPTAICDALEEAAGAGTAIVTFDSDTDPECRDLYISQADAAGIAKVQVEMVAEQIGGSGEIAILSAAANATSENEGIALMEEGLDADYPDIELVEDEYQVTNNSAVEKKPRFQRIIRRSVSLRKSFDFHCSTSFCMGMSSGSQWFARMLE